MAVETGLGDTDMNLDYRFMIRALSVILVVIIATVAVQLIVSQSIVKLRPADYRTVIAEDDWSITYKITTYRKTAFNDWVPKESVLTIPKEK